MLLLLRDYATFDYAKFAILERDYATHYASIIRYAIKALNYFSCGYVSLLEDKTARCVTHTPVYSYTCLCTHTVLKSCPAEL